MISPEDGIQCFEKIQRMCDEWTDPPSGPPPYYAHEIRHIFDIAGQIVVQIELTVDTAEYEHLSYLGMDAMNGVLVNQNPWDVLGEVRTNSKFSPNRLLINCFSA